MGVLVSSGALFKRPHITEVKHQKVNKNVQVIDGKPSSFWEYGGSGTIDGPIGTSLVMVTTRLPGRRRYAGKHNANWTWYTNNGIWWNHKFKLSFKTRRPIMHSNQWQLLGIGLRRILVPCSAGVFDVWRAVHYNVLPARQWGMIAIGKVDDGFYSPPSSGRPWWVSIPIWILTIHDKLEFLYILSNFIWATTTTCATSIRLGHQQWVSPSVHLIESTNGNVPGTRYVSFIDVLCVSSVNLEITGWYLSYKTWYETQVKRSVTVEIELAWFWAKVWKKLPAHL